MLDASVALKWFLPEEDSEPARRLLFRLLAGVDELIVPDLLLAEVGRELRKAIQRKRLSPGDAVTALDFMLETPLRWVCVFEVARAALQLFIERKGPFFDAVYVALGQSRGCAVVTADRGMDREVRSARAYPAFGRGRGLRAEG